MYMNSVDFSTDPKPIANQAGVDKKQQVRDEISYFVVTSVFLHPKLSHIDAVELSPSLACILPKREHRNIVAEAGQCLGFSTNPGVLGVVGIGKHTDSFSHETWNGKHRELQMSYEISFVADVP
jgi:hypothetical protein